MTSDKKILVVGGSGYIGSHTVLALLDNQFEVVIFDKANPNKSFSQYISKNNSHCRIVLGNLLDSESIETLIKNEKFDGVIIEQLKVT